MRHRQSSIVFAILLLSSIFLVSCGGPIEGVTETSVALTVASIAQGTAFAATQDALVMTNVAQTVAAMPLPSNPGETAIPISEIGTSVAQTVAAQFDDYNSSILMRMNEEASVANVRKGPDTCFAIVTTLNSGELASVIGREPTNKWYLIELMDGTVGWFWAEYANLVDAGRGNQIPLASSIPLCPATQLPPTLTSSPVPQPPQPQTPTRNPTPSPLPPSPTAESCAYPSCSTPTGEPIPTVGPTPTTNSCSNPPCSYP